MAEALEEITGMPRGGSYGGAALKERYNSSELQKMDRVVQLRVRGYEIALPSMTRLSTLLGQGGTDSSNCTSSSNASTSQKDVYEATASSTGHASADALRIDASVQSSCKK